MLIVFTVLQVVCALGLVALTAVTTTKSEQGGSGFGWGTIGGKASSTIAGLEDQLERVTMYVAIAFLLVSAVVGALAFRAA
jgi:preprotein translocase subunit SecG